MVLAAERPPVNTVLTVIATKAVLMVHARVMVLVLAVVRLVAEIAVQLAAVQVPVLQILAFGLAPGRVAQEAALIKA